MSHICKKMEKENGWQEILVSGQEPQIGWVFNYATHNFDPPKDQIHFASRDLLFYQIQCENKNKIFKEFHSKMIQYSNYPWYDDYKQSQAKDVIYVRTTKVKEKKVQNDFECHQPSQAVVTSLCYKASVDILLHFDKRVTDSMAKQLYIYLSNVLNGSKVEFLPPFIDRTVKVVNVYCKGNRRKYDNKSLFGLKEACRILQEHECKLLTSVKVMNQLFTKKSDFLSIPKKKYIPLSLMNLPSINHYENKDGFRSENRIMSGLSVNGTSHIGSCFMNDGEYSQSKEYSVSDAFKLRSLGRAKLLSGLNNKYPVIYKKYEDIFKKNNTNAENTNIQSTIKDQESLNSCHVPKRKLKKNSQKSAINCQSMTSESDDDALNQNQIAGNHKEPFRKDKNRNKKRNESIEKCNTVYNFDNSSSSSYKGRRCAVSDQIVESVANLNVKLPTPVNYQLEVMPPLPVNGIKVLQHEAYLKSISEDVMNKLEEEIFHFAIVSNVHNSKTISKNIWELALIANYQVKRVQYTTSTVDDILVQAVHKVCQKNSIDSKNCLKRLSLCSTKPLRNAIEGTLVGLNEIYIHSKQTTVEEKNFDTKIIKRGKKDINNNKLDDDKCLITLLCNWCNKIHKLERISSKVSSHITDQDLVLRCTECQCEGWKHRNLNEDCDDVSFRVSPNRILQYTKKRLERILLKHVVFGMKLELHQALMLFLEGNEDNSYKDFIMDLFKFTNFQH